MKIQSGSGKARGSGSGNQRWRALCHRQDFIRRTTRRSSRGSALNSWTIHQSTMTNAILIPRLRRRGCCRRARNRSARTLCLHGLGDVRVTVILHLVLLRPGGRPCARRYPCHPRHSASRHSFNEERSLFRRLIPKAIRFCARRRNLP